MTEQNETLYDRLAYLAGSRSPREISRKLSLAYNTVRNYGQGRLPQGEMLVDFSARHGVSIDWLLLGKGEPYMGEEDRISVAKNRRVIPPAAVAQPQLQATQSGPAEITVSFTIKLPFTPGMEDAAPRQEDWDARRSEIYSKALSLEGVTDQELDPGGEEASEEN